MLSHEFCILTTFKSKFSVTDGVIVGVWVNVDDIVGVELNLVRSISQLDVLVSKVTITTKIIV